MAISGVSVRGLNSAIRSMERLGVEVSDLKAAFKKIGNLVAGDAKTIINNRTGTLSSSVRASNSKNKAIVRAGNARVVYAGVINFGGYNNIVGQHFLEKAVERNETNIVQLIESELGALIRRLDLD